MNQSSGSGGGLLSGFAAGGYLRDAGFWVSVVVVNLVVAFALVTLGVPGYRR